MKKGYKQSEEHIEKRFSITTRKKMSLARMGKTPWNKGKAYSIEVCKKMSLAHKGKARPWRIGIKLPPVTAEHKKKISISLSGKLPKNLVTLHSLPRTEQWKKRIGMANKTSRKLKGSDSPHWKGGITPKNTKLRNSIEMRLWRQTVFIRDRWACQMCTQIGGKLHADHIRPFAIFPELRFAIDNGQTLCVACHRVKTKKDLPIIRSMRLLETNTN